jgi:Barstar (barnase inhibitor)
MKPVRIPVLPIVTPVSRASQPALEAALRRHGYRLVQLDGREVRDAASFIQRAAIDLPMPAGVTPRRWSGLVDALWQALSELEEPGIAIVWTDADRMLEGGLGDLLLAADCFTDVARQVYEARELVVKVFLVGDGINFPRLTFEAPPG